METFFGRLYKYKESEFKNAKENYLTEILSQCLIVDLQFREKFLALLEIKNAKELVCKTQYADKDYGRPDLYILVDEKIEIIIECKVDNTQSLKQLEKYSELLKKRNSEERHLVFLTKYYELTEDFKDVAFSHIRWFQVYKLLIGSTNQLSIEFSKYLIEEKMSTVVPFNKTELNAIKSFSETLGKMNDFLGRVKDVLKSRTNSPIRQDISIQERIIGLICNLKTGRLWIGFYQFDNHDEIQVCVSIEANKADSHFKELHQYLDSKNFNNYENEEGLRTWLNAHNLSDFFKNETFNVEEAVSFIEERLDALGPWFFK